MSLAACGDEAWPGAAPAAGRRWTCRTGLRVGWAVSAQRPRGRRIANGAVQTMCGRGGAEGPQILMHGLATWCAAQLAPPAAICHSLPAQGCSQACTQSAAGREAALKSSATSGRLACRGTAGLSQQQQAPLSEAATAPPAQGAVEQPQRGGARPKWAPQAPRSSPGWSFCPGEQSGAPRRPPCPARSSPVVLPPPVFPSSRRTVPGARPPLLQAPHPMNKCPQVRQQHWRPAAQQVPAVHLRVQVSAPASAAAASLILIWHLLRLVCCWGTCAGPSQARRSQLWLRNCNAAASRLQRTPRPTVLMAPAALPPRRCPVFLTLCHMLACSCMSYAVAASRCVPLQAVKSRKQFYKISLLALIFCLTVVLGNVSLRFIPVSFNQVRAAQPQATAQHSVIGWQVEGWAVFWQPSYLCAPLLTRSSPLRLPDIRQSAPRRLPSPRCWAT